MCIFVISRKETMVTVLLVLSICIVVVCGSCLVDPSTMGTLLPPVNIPGYGMCPRGYLCPNSDPSNVSTYPRVCPATAECLQVRLGSGFCEPQGTYEPYVCPAGFYCVTAYEKRICPEGYFCPVGTTEPYKCAPIANCPAGTAVSYDYGCLVLVGVLDVVFLAVWLWVMRRRIITTNKCVNNDMRIMDEHGVQLSGWQSVNKGERELLYRAINHRRGPMDGLTFVFSNLSVTIPPKDGEPEKVVLRSVSGTLKPGQVTAVMGPSGAGKTVFFTALLSKLESSWKTTGGLSINGFGPEDYERFRHVIGYVAQDDSLHNEISVADNVWYSSELRLPRSFSEDDRDTLRRIVMNGFGISNLQQATAGTLSGSQKKKCSIAVELASAPAALFLDEPTSALDATAAHDLCKSLTALAQESNMTVVMVIHQPRVEIWDDLDQVLFLAPGGFTVYQGPKSEAMEYFQRELGFQFGTGNPADIIIDGIAEHRDRCIEAWERKLCLGDSARPVDDAEQSPCATAATEMNMTHTDPPRSSCPNPDEPATFLRQIVLSHNRSLLKQSTSLSSLVLDLVLCMIAAAVMASAAVQTRYVGVLVSPYALISPKHIAYLLAMLAMFYQIAVAATTSVTALRSFMGERECYWREMATGGHNRLAYYIGTSLGDIYRIVLTSLHFAVVAYLMFQPLQSFWQFYLIIILIFLCFDSQSSMLSMVLAPSSAPLLVTVAGVFVALLNGYPKIPALNYIGFTFYLTEALMSQEWGYTNNLYNQVMEQYKTDRYGLDLGIVVLIFVIYRAIGFLLLKFSNRDRQR